MNDNVRQDRGQRKSQGGGGSVDERGMDSARRASGRVPQRT